MRRISEKQKQRNTEKAETSKALHKFFKSLWDEREDEEGVVHCFETGIPLEGRIYRSNTACYDHVLEKGSKAYSDYMFVKKNIVIVHPDVHAQKTHNIDKCPKIKAYREKLIALHEEGKLYD